MGGIPPRVLEVSMLGGWELKVNGEPVPNSAWKSKKALSLFRYLLAHRGSKVHKETLLNVFWPDSSPEEATGTLHTTIYFLRRIIQPDRAAYAGASSFIRFSGGTYCFEPGESCRLDVDQFLDHYAHGAALEAIDPDRALDHYRQALALYRGDLLVDEAFKDWAEGARSELRDVFINLSLRAAHLLARVPDGVSEAVRICRAALANDPYREELHQAIMAFLIQVGRHAEAASQYRQLKALLHKEFDLLPSPETRALFEKMQGYDTDIRTFRAAAPDDVEDGPYVCDANAFETIRTVALRMQTRHGLPIGIITLSLGSRNAERGADVVRLLQGQLRRSDVLCREDAAVRILLCFASYTGCDIVKRRVLQALDRAGLYDVQIQTSVFEGDRMTPQPSEPMERNAQRRVLGRSM